MVLDVRDGDRREQDQEHKVPDPELSPARNPARRADGRLGFSHDPRPLAARPYGSRVESISFDRRAAQLLQAAAELPEGQLIDGADGVAFVEIELGHDADPAGDPLAIAGDRSGDTPG